MVVVSQTKKAEQLFGFFFRGTDGNRTSDTRIFSPLLYQLSYGTSVFFALQRYDFFRYRQGKFGKKKIFFAYEIISR